MDLGEWGDEQGIGRNLRCERSVWLRCNFRRDYTTDGHRVPCTFDEGAVMRRAVCALVTVIWIACATTTFAQEAAEIRCPANGTMLRFSTSRDMLEVVRDLGGGVCRYRNTTNQREYDRFLTLDAKSKLFEPNLDKLRMLGPLQVGKSVSIPYSGPANRGTDGAWDITISVEKFETVKVPVGDLPAFVVLQDEHTFRGSGHWQWRWWYSPIVHYAVQFEFVTLNGNPPMPYPRDWKLVELKPR
jgi:hypothetical protein